MNDQATMIITTHLVDEIEQILNRVVFIHEGKNIGEFCCEDLRIEEGLSVSD